MGNGNKPAFNAMHTDAWGHTFMSGGMTKRELFAAMTMQGLISSWPAEDRYDATRVATFAVGCADALLAALEETK